MITKNNTKYSTELYSIFLLFGSKDIQLYREPMNNNRDGQVGQLTLLNMGKQTTCQHMK